MRTLFPLLLLGCAPTRPDDARYRPGFSRYDELATVDGPEGWVRVHYSDRGPNAVDQTDDDDDVPDRAEDMAANAESMIRYFQWLGYSRPVAESEVGLDEPGGSDALDIYLLDIEGRSLSHDRVVVDACDGTRCAVHLLQQCNDPEGNDLVDVVFGAVLAAYDGTSAEPDWLVEGATAQARASFEDHLKWSVMVYADPFLQATDCGLEEVDGRGRCGRVAEGTALLWPFLDDALGEDSLLHMVEATVEYDGVAALESALERSGATLVELWPDFASWNLETGPRARKDWDPLDADRFDGVVATAEGGTIYDNAKLQPLSARYYRLDHPGGPLWVGTGGDAGPLRLSLHPVLEGQADGPLDEALGPWALNGGAATMLADVPAGGVWVTLSHPDRNAGAERVKLCLGASEDEVSPCGSDCSGSLLLPLPLPLLPLPFVALRRQKPRPPPTR